MDDSSDKITLDEEDIDFIINCLREKQRKLQLYDEDTISYRKVLKKILVLKMNILKEKLS